MTTATPAGEPFEGVIGDTVDASQPWWPAAKLKASVAPGAKLWVDLPPPKELAAQLQLHVEASAVQGTDDLAQAKARIAVAAFSLLSSAVHSGSLILGNKFRTASESKSIRLRCEFRRGVLRKLILSKVGNFAIDLPDANVMVQVSGTFGSRQEEAQRLGRILRPKEGEVPARFYSLVSRDTREMDFAHHRQLFLTEQGYTYEILDESDLALDDVIRPAATG